MNLLSLIFCVFGLLITPFASADLVEDMARSIASDDVVINDEILSEISWNDPIFSRQGEQRNVASLTDEANDTEGEFIGELSVQREIPFTYPTVTRRWLEQKTLNEIEAKSAKN